MVAAWAIGLAVACKVFSWGGPFSDGLELTKIIAIFSTPPIAIAAVLCGVFPYSVGRHPTIWALSAVATACLLCLPWFGSAATLSFLVSLPAGLAFMLSVWRWPLASAPKERAGGQ